MRIFLLYLSLFLQSKKRDIMDSKGYGDSFYNQGSISASSSGTSFPTHNPEFQALHKTMSEISSGLRILEDRYYNLRKKVQLTDQSLLETQRNFFKEKRLMDDELMELKTRVQNLSEQLEVMRMDIGDAVKQKDFRVLEKYLDFWDPMIFITRKEAGEIIDSELDRGNQVKEEDKQ